MTKENRRKQKRGILPFRRSNGATSSSAVDDIGVYEEVGGAAASDYYVGDTNPAPQSPSADSYPSSGDTSYGSSSSTDSGSYSSTDGGSW